ncbi:MULTISPECIES: DUF5682 family protein [unclassified Mesorhizobium]|uniref:DUF5682 family protein n=1 Tax=unclassified Mesorhizobium TaxID=325217 RepID=UPI000FD8287F|nr:MULTISPECIES: DUF5682 family protein [unclassified Mesorhizobium]TGR44164.1 hypothetical protein EN842_28645 [bacterium M00.F.Ca.ET.199.01.1.1]TGU33029.1 hypothetical protein EN799_23880 [bacterium M00.F.Ca.ET.156.01.1.1]TGV87235.1 hypothetical protein EN792_012115 [Mesorhizobium sp. M00.F.Ca.ET.149.01.1.1]TGR27318.1 hypothetical protein EN845_13365 [Mesorhizobium sp. M8A.F.Ca.ET.202.01.1.1]TGR28335.1 hypothetical protein EN840_10210 [Mesorhizobium sp. M8A.F.Ca.ET.197.01.1.1]
MAQGEVSYFGIRHHGPGSADSLVQALQDLKPVAVLIEGPADASALLPLLARPEMQPPVALLCYPEDDPASTSFWPFAEFSPEYQAALWAVGNNAALRFIDLPSSARVAPLDDAQEAAADETEAKVESETAPHLRDPIGALAQAAGYEDGESWWADIIEQNPEPGPIFAAIADAMTTLREGEGPLAEFEAKREAHMRLEIAAARKEFDGPIAVVCGAFHVPALQATRPQKEDQALLKGLARRKSTMTWAPWTGPRLALGFGYGAGVVAPGWCKHLWRTRGRHDAATLWLAMIAAVLRAKGHMVSTASLIEAERLARALAVIRERPKPGFEELRDAAIAALFNGEAILWALVEAELLLGADVGEIPPDTPLAPLIEDLQRNQKAARLKPEALERELSVDLRSESGLFRSTLLHRLNVLGVHWGKLTDAGRSRGTFRERWTLSWEPEYAVRLVENLVHGPTIEKAANGRLIQMISAAASLDALAALVQGAITANLSEASTVGLATLEERAAHSSECLEILASVPPLADIIRYGEARKTETARLSGLLARLIVEGGIALPYAARDLDAQASSALVGAMRKADEAIKLVEPEQDVLDAWRNGLAAVLDGSRSTALVAGCAAHLLYEAGHLSAEAAAGLIARRLSPGTAVTEAAGFFEGFFSTAGQRLIYDEGLRGAVDAWLKSLDEEAFVAHLPLLRRVFSHLDSMERRRLIEAVLGRARRLPAGLTPTPDGGEAWRRHLDRLAPLLRGENDHG